MDGLIEGPITFIPVGPITFIHDPGPGRRRREGLMDGRVEGRRMDGWVDEWIG